jgi:predicted NUDIX family NTP pyrophosphohydrolase
MRLSAGILVVRRRIEGPEFLLAHPGGPFWTGRQDHVWSVPKGLAYGGEPLIQTARREFFEETGLSAPTIGASLTPLKQPGGKIVHAWLAEADLDLAPFRSNDFTLVWPPRSGRVQTFPEVDQIAYFPLAQAALRILPGQAPFLAEAASLLG